MTFVNVDNPSNDSLHSGRQLLRLNSFLIQQLNELSRDEKTTLWVTLLAALQTLLQRYTGSADFLLEFPHSVGERLDCGQSAQPATALIQRLDLSRDPSFQDLLQRTRTAVDVALKHQELPVANLIVAILADRGITTARPIRVLFHFCQEPRRTSKLPDAALSGLDIGSGAEGYYLSLRVAQRSKALAYSFESDDDLCDVRLESHFQTLLQGISLDRRQRISRLPILAQAERQQLLVAWNAKSEKPAEGLFRHQLFESQVDMTPDATAIVSPDESPGSPANKLSTPSGPSGRALAQRALTYQELEMRANQLANYLIQLGVGPEVPVGLCMETSPELVVAILAVFKAAGACVPLDPSFPNDQLGYMAHHANVVVMLTQQRFLEKLPHGDRTVLCVDDDWSRLISGESTHRPVSRLSNDNLSFVFYTSGSTGRPKAVMLPHRKIAPRRPTSEFNAHDRHLLKASIGFTPLQLEIFSPLTTGGRIIVAPPEIRLDSARLVELIARCQITVMNVVPSLLRQLLNESGLERCQSLRHVVCFGEPLTTELRERFFAQFDAVLSVHYGTTEAPSITALTLTRTDAQPKDTIGRTNANRSVYVLDAHQQPVPIGIPGELFVGGVLSRGYLKGPDLTAERFVPNPIPHTQEERLYRTGDRVRYLQDGNLQFLGRFDHQVKIRGFRVELSEVEAILSQHADVDSAVVIVRKDHVGSNQLVAYAACAGKSTPEIAQLRRFLATKLPGYMIPARFVILKSMPLGHNGKVDRCALPEPELSLDTLGDSFVAPRDETEDKLANIWHELFGVPRVSIFDNFLELGGNSILAMQLVARIANVLEIKLRPSTPFQSPTIAELAKQITTLRSGGTGS